MLRKEGKYNNVKCLIKTTKERKRVEAKTRNQEQGNKEETVRNMVNINPTTSVTFTLNTNGLMHQSKHRDVRVNSKNKLKQNAV